MNDSVSTVRAHLATTSAPKDAVLLVDPASDRCLYFSQLEDRAGALTALAYAHGWEPGRRIAFATRDSYAAAELFVAAIHAGIAVIPLNVEAGANHLAAVLERGRICLVITTPELAADASQWCAAASEGLGLATTDELAAITPVPLRSIDRDDEAFVMYTSGSTGVPKGVVLSHRNAMAAGRNNRAGYEWTTDDRIMCPLPFWHMNACDKALGAMASGSAMIVPPRFRVGEFWSWTTTHRPTVMIIVPTVASELLQHHNEDTAPAADVLDAVRYVGSSSAPLNAAVHDEFVATFGIPMIEAFGMSETGTIFVTTPPPASGSPGSVGRPAGWEVRVVDGDGNTLDTDEVGALELRGDALTVGYDDSDAFAAAVTPDGWFRTGDIGRFNSTGEFFVVGRAKEIIIKGGVNIAPREIDEVIASHPAVVEVATVGVHDALLGQDIETFIVLRPDSDAGQVVNELSQLCLEQLGALKTPRSINPIEELPKGPGGKIQPLKLLDLVEDHDAGRGDVRTAGVAEDRTLPTTPVEHIVHELWASLLATEALGTHENFFERGGYSLLALECCVTLRGQLRLQIPLAMLFESPTVASFAEMITAQAWLRSDDSDQIADPPTREPRDLAEFVKSLDEAERHELERAVLAAERHDDDAEPDASAILLNTGPVDDPEGTLPLFCPYGPYQYAAIAEHLADTTAVYGLFTSDETEGSDGTRLTVPDLASAYIAAMRMVQPEGPYHLLGFSFGGRVSLEMAHQLRAGGHDVALVAPIDTFMGPLVSWWHPRMIRRTITSRIGRVVGRGSRSLEQEGHAPASAFVERVRDEQVQYRRWASARHQTPHYDGPIHLLRAKRVIGGRLARSQNSSLGWDAVTADLHRHEFDATHHDMVLEPTASRLAEVVRPLLTPVGESDHPRRTRVYLHPLIDSRRWDRYQPRPDDIVISTSMKAGTTWMQRIISMLVLESTAPVDLDAHSPWVESRTGDPVDTLMAHLDGQQHRRFLKSHLPADALPWHDAVSYIVVGRDTRDMFLSMHNHYANYTPEVLRTFNALPGSLHLDPAPETPQELWPRWISTGSFPWEQDGAPFWSHHHHAASFWQYRHLANVLFVHYDDLLSDLAGEIQRISRFLGIEVTAEQVEAYAHAASFATMKSQGAQLVPHAEAAFHGGSSTFFHRGESARWRTELSPADIELYEANAAKTLTPALKAWLEQGRLGFDPDSPES